MAKTGSVTWSGDVTAVSTLGVHAVTVTVRDADGNISTSAGSGYKVALVVAALCRNTVDPISVQPLITHRASRNPHACR